MTVERTIATTIHGRYVVDAHDRGTPSLLLVGFHGYGELAGTHLARLQALRPDPSVALVSVQGLHRFYRWRGDELAASWMTREDRDLMIADNVGYVDAVVEAVTRESGAPGSLVFAGFSQGASMAYRAAALGRAVAHGVIALGGDIPPELPASALARIPAVLIGWGARDEFYPAGKRAADERRLRDAGAAVEVAALDAGHAWTGAFTQAASDWLRRRR